MDRDRRRSLYSAPCVYGRMPLNTSLQRGRLEGGGRVEGGDEEHRDGGEGGHGGSSAWATGECTGPAITYTQRNGAESERLVSGAIGRGARGGWGGGVAEHVDKSPAAAFAFSPVVLGSVIAGLPVSSATNGEDERPIPAEVRGEK